MASEKEKPKPEGGAKPVAKGKYSGTNFKKLESLFPEVRAASNRSRLLEQIGSYDPKSLVGEVRADLKESNLPDDALDRIIDEAERTGDYNQLAQIAPRLVPVRYAKSLGPFNVTLSLYPEQALEGAPDRVYRAVAGSVNKPYLEKIEADGEFKQPHLDLLSRLELLRDSESSDSEKRIPAREKIFKEYMGSLNLEKTDGDVRDSFENFVKALGLDRVTYSDQTNKDFDGFVKKLSEDNGRSYLATIARDAIPEAINREFSQGLENGN